MAKIITLFCIFFPSIYLTEQASFLSQDYINNINKVAKTWKVSSLIYYLIQKFMFDFYENNSCSIFNKWISKMYCTRNDTKHKIYNTCEPNKQNNFGYN